MCCIAIILFLHFKQKEDKHGITPILAAIWENHISAVKLLLAKVGSFVFCFLCHSIV